MQGRSGSCLKDHLLCCFASAAAQPETRQYTPGWFMHSFWSWDKLCLIPAYRKLCCWAMKLTLLENHLVNLLEYPSCKICPYISGGEKYEIKPFKPASGNKAVVGFAVSFQETTQTNTTVCKVILPPLFSFQYIHCELFSLLKQHQRKLEEIQQSESRDMGDRERNRDRVNQTRSERNQSPPTGSRAKLLFSLYGKNSSKSHRIVLGVQSESR